MRKESRFKSLTFLVLAGFFILARPVSAADRVLDVQVHEPAPASLTAYFSVLEDPGRALTLDMVQGADLSSQFKTDLPAGEALNFGYTHSAYWLRLTLHNGNDQALERLLEIRSSGLSSIQYHQALDNGKVQLVSTGSILPFNTRPYANRYFVFPVKLPAHSRQTLYLRIQSNGPISIPALLWEPGSFDAYERADYASQAWYFGIASAMVLFNLLLFIGLRDPAYLFYVVFVTCMAMTIATQNGLAKEFLWNDSPLWSNIATNVGYSMSLATLLVFMRHMLNTHKVIAHSDRLLKPLIALFLLSPVGFAYALPTLIKPAAMLYAATGALILGMGVWCVVKRQRNAYFFVAAFAVLCLAAMSTVFRAFGWLPTNPITVNALQFGSGLEMLLLAFALADRFNEIRKEKAGAQQQAFQAQRLLVENLQTSERLLEERVRQRTAELDQKNIALTHAISSLETVERIAQHDLKTPLGSLAAAPALLRAGRVMSTQEEEVLRMMEVAANRALRMVDLSLDIYRMESGHYVPKPVCIDLTALTLSVIKDLTAQAQSKAVTIEIAGHLPPVLVSAEESLCYSIIANLLKNAVEAAPMKSIARVVLQDGPMVALHVHNEGAVPTHLREQFFTKYSTTGKLGGTGLGTYSSHLLTRVQGGRLSMETSDRLGTTLTLELPRWAPLEGAKPTSSPLLMPSGDAATPPNLTRQRILLVDDDEFNRTITLAQLPHPPLELESAINGHQALEIVRQRRPDIIILDIEMPVMDGMEALLHIREFQAATGQEPSLIVAYSGHDDAQSQARFLAHGFDKCLRKPAASKELLALLKQTSPA